MDHRQNLWLWKREIPQCFIRWKCCPWVQKSKWCYCIMCIILNELEIRRRTPSTITALFFFFFNILQIFFLCTLSWAPLTAHLLSLFMAVNRSAMVANWPPESVWSEPDIRHMSGSSTTHSIRQTEQAVLLKHGLFKPQPLIPSNFVSKRPFFLFWTNRHVQLTGRGTELHSMAD